MVFDLEFYGQCSLFLVELGANISYKVHITQRLKDWLTEKLTNYLAYTMKRHLETMTVC